MAGMKRVLLLVGLSLLSILLISGGFLFSYQRVFAGKIYPNVFFAGVDLTGKTEAQAQLLLRKKANELSNKVVAFRANNKEVKVKVSDIGIKLDPNEIFKKSYQIGRTGNLKADIVTITRALFEKYSVDTSAFLDKVKYDDFVQIAIGQLNTASSDASLKVENGEVKLTQSANGLEVDLDDLSKKIEQLTNITADSGATAIDLKLKVKEPAISSLDFEDAKNQANNLLAKKIVFTYNGKNYIPSHQTIGNWIDFTDNNGQSSVSLNMSGVKAYLVTVGKNIEITKADSKVSVQTGQVLQEGREGVYLDKDAAVASLQSQISNDDVAINLAVTKVPPGEIKVDETKGLELGRYQGKYIDVNLATQQLCRLDGTTLIDCFMTSTGKPSTPTPTGSFAITRKNPRGWAPNPGVWMPWFQEFKAGGYGIHELVEWPDGAKEPLTNLGLTVSHGCVRLGPGIAEMMFNWTDIGTPVYIHR